MQSLWKGDIPYFYFELNRKGIFSNSEEIETKYFAQTAIEKLEARLEMLSEKDLKKQCEYIQVAMLLMPEQRKRLRNSVYVQQEEDGCKGNPTDREKAIQSLIERLMNSAAWNEERTEVNWPKVELSPVGKWTWRIKPLDMYLYGGVSGIFLLMCALKETTQRKETEEMFLVLRNMLFSYTEKGCTSLDNLHSRNTGAYDGESSIVYTYLSLYRMCGEIVFLEYAKKHAEIVAELLETDKKYDLLSGNAGAAKVFILLYEVTMEQKYIELAERAISVLELAAKKQEYGIGWCIMGDTVPMAGMAHGNSGILLPIVFLWKITGKKNYEELAEKILEYEDSLYDAELNNWKDMRGGRTENGEDTVAWCHGAAGILLSRVLCYKEVENPEWRKRLEKDIWKAYEKLKKYWKRDSWCLCHGTYGNLWILERAAEIMGEKLTISAQADIELLPQEMLNPGLFSGYGGILYYLLREKTDKISKILELYTV